MPLEHLWQTKSAATTCHAQNQQRLALDCLHSEHPSAAGAMMNDILEKLKGGDRRSIGKSGEAVKDVAKTPALFTDLFAGLFDADPLIRMRAADAVEKSTRKSPELLRPWTGALLEQISLLQEKEVRWHVAQLIPRLSLNPGEQERAAQILMGYLDDESSIVRTCSMQALADLALRDGRLRSQVAPLLERLTRTGTPAMRSRGRKLLKQLGHSSIPDSKKPVVR